MRSQKALISDHEEEGEDEEVEKVEDDVDEERNEEEEKCKEQEVIQVQLLQLFSRKVNVSRLRHLPAWDTSENSAITSWSQGFSHETIEVIFIYNV